MTTCILKNYRVDNLNGNSKQSRISIKKYFIKQYYTIGIASYTLVGTLEIVPILIQNYANLCV